MPSRGERRHTTYSAPVGCVDLAAFDDQGEPYQIYACDYCLPWHAEVIIDDDGTPLVREWHAIECEVFEDMIDSVDRPEEF